MATKLSVLTMAAAFLVIPTQLMAGGPPRLFVPVDGVTDDNTEECAKRLAVALKDKLWSHPGRPNGVQIHQHRNQSYARFYVEHDVRLSDIDAALEGTKFSVPRDKLHLFGHVILEIDDTKRAEQLVADLAAMRFVSVAEWKRQQGGILVTVDMPYPVSNNSTERESLGEGTFQWNDFASDRSVKSEPQATAQMLPSFSALQDVLAKHKSSVKDVRLSSRWGCRPLGFVAVPSIPNIVGNFAFSNSSERVTLALAVRVDQDGKMTLHWQTVSGDVPIDDFSYREGKLSFRSKLGDYEGELKQPNALNGTFTTERGEFSVLARRMGIPIIGIWNLEVASERGSRKEILKINPDMSGSYGATPIKKVHLESDIPISSKLESRRVTFAAVSRTGERRSFAGEVTGSKLSGEITTGNDSEKVAGKRND